MKIWKNIQTQAVKFRQEPTMPLLEKTEEERPKVVRKSTLVYPVTIQELLAHDRQPQDYEEVKWSPIEILNLRRFNVVVISYGMHSPYVMQR